ncbi:MAG: radical SAM family heme chaperone HemW [Candidatus Spyradocola sp.]|jgi:oxygen-independent coproporphyrinogen-3 oxidase
MMLYLHIPFCARKCAYCDFVSYAGQADKMSRYVDALLAEMDRRPCAEPVTSVFFGGGTPSLLPAGEFARALEGLRRRYVLTQDCEISAEVNPGTVTADWLRAAVEGGVNRLSVGIQAVQPELLRRIGRIHDFAQAQETFALAREAGLTNLSADLMYALPGQTIEDWEESLRAVLSLAPRHLSCYALTVAEGTPFGDLDARGRLPRPSEDEEIAMQDRTLRLLGEAGFQRYEVSNYALPGFPCRHNLGYWMRKDYIGLGCAAHSLEGNLRRANPSGLDDYLAGAPLALEARLSPEEEDFESLMLGLRLVDGVELSERAFARFSDGIHRFAGLGLLCAQGRHVRLTAHGMDVMNAILEEFLP